MTSRNSSASPLNVPETQPLPSPPPSPAGGSGRSSAVDLCSRSQSPAALGQSAMRKAFLQQGFAASAEAARANPKYRWSSSETQQPQEDPEAQEHETCVFGDCDICNSTFSSDVSPPPRICPRCHEKSKNAQVKTEKGKGKEEESTGLTEYEKLRRAAFQKHARERLPDLDSTVPWSHEITVGRPLSQEEKDRMQELFGGAATAKPSAKPKDRTPSQKPKEKRKRDESSDDDAAPGFGWLSSRGGMSSNMPASPSSASVGPKASSSSA